MHVRGTQIVHIIIVVSALIGQLQLMRHLQFVDGNTLRMK